VTRAGRGVGLLAVSAIFLAPLLAAFLAAVMSDRQVFTAALWPAPFRWANFTDALERQPLLDAALNTVVVAGLSTIGTLLSSIPAAYALARLQWRGRQFALLLVIAVFLLPAQVSAIPLYKAFAELGWVGTLLPLIVPSFLGSAFAIFVLRQFFLGVPEAMLDAARLEGSGEWGVLRRVVLPMTRPGIAAVALLNAIFVWNDFFTPYLYIGQKPELWTASVALVQYRSMHQVEWNLTMAAATIVTVPLIIVFLLAQRALTDGIAAQAPVA
jgi:multiple sugar transport system permease protein